MYCLDRSRDHFLLIRVLMLNIGRKEKTIGARTDLSEKGLTFYDKSDRVAVLFVGNTEKAEKCDSDGYRSRVRAFMTDKLILGFIRRMPGFSPTVTKVFEVCNRPATSSHDLNKVISLDPVLTGRVMKLVNSAYYSLGKEVTSLIHAIILLGLNTVKNLALSTAVLESIGGMNSFRSLSMDDFWVHSLGVGVIARSFARQTGTPVTEQEEYFVAGLLHDLGKIPLNHCYPEKYNSALETVMTERLSLHEAEKMAFGFDHCAVGGLIADKWRLHRNFSEVCLHHHDLADGGSGNRHFISIISLANCYANHWHIGAAGDSPPQAAVMERLQNAVGLEPARIEALRENVLEDIENARIFLQVATEG